MSLTFTGAADKAAGFARLTDLPNSVAVAPGGATMTLTAANSGNLILIDTATTTITLPPPALGLTFTFVVTTTATAQKIVTDAATAFIVGGLSMVSAGTSSGAGNFNGSTHRSFTMNGTTGGGIVGSTFTLTCINVPTATQVTNHWAIYGCLQASGVASLSVATS